MRRWSVLLLCSSVLSAQDFTQRGFWETRVILFPQTGTNDSSHVVGDSLFRYEASKTLLPGLRLSGSFDARTDTHLQTEREFRIDFGDRSIRRPALSVRRLSLLYNRGKWTAEIGKQFVRWGKADILNPTDRFAPRDFLNVVDNDFLPITAARLTYESGSNTIDLVVQPFFTPSRTPLLNQRWAVLPDTPGFRVIDIGANYPGGPNVGARFNHIGRRYEGSVSFYEGHNHLPLFDAILGRNPFTVAVFRYYPQLRQYGADVAVPLRWFTIKGEAGYFTSNTKTADEYALYVIQLERQSGEWSFVGGYAGEVVTTSRSQQGFSPDRGLTHAFLGRAGYTIDVNRSVAVETAVRENLAGLWIRLEYSQAFGQHWRGTAGYTLIRGREGDFLGQYHRNSHAILALRYSF